MMEMTTPCLRRHGGHHVPVVWLLMLAAGVSSQRRSIERISTFDSGVMGGGWRILPTLPSGMSAGERLVLPVSADSSPSYFLAPNELVSRVKAAAGQETVPGLS